MDPENPRQEEKNSENPNDGNPNQGHAPGPYGMHPHLPSMNMYARMPGAEYMVPPMNVLPSMNSNVNLLQGGMHQGAMHGMMMPNQYALMENSHLPMPHNMEHLVNYLPPNHMNPGMHPHAVPQHPHHYSQPSNASSPAPSSASSSSASAEAPKSAITDGSAVFFCFNDSKYDSLLHPSKIFIAKRNPSVKDFASLIKTVYHISTPLGFSWKIDEKTKETQFEETEMSTVSVPINNRNHVVFVKTIEVAAVSIDSNTITKTIAAVAGAADDSDSENESIPTLGSIIPKQVSKLLKSYNYPKAVTDSYENLKLDRESLKEMNDETLKEMGITNLECRASLLQSIQQYKHKRGMKRSQQEIKESKEGKKLKQKNKVKIRFKDLDALIQHPQISVKVGDVVFCRENISIAGYISEKSGRYSVEYEMNESGPPAPPNSTEGKRRVGTLSKFYKDVTGNSLQEKGDSWNNIFFFDSVSWKRENPNGEIGDPLQIPAPYLRTLEDIKRIIRGPKKAVSAFLYFCNENRNIPNISPPDFPKVIGEMWKNLTEDQKQKYRIMEAQDKIRFQQEKQNWEKTYPEAAAQASGDNIHPVQIETLPRIGSVQVQVHSMQPYPYSLANAMHHYHQQQHPIHHQEAPPHHPHEPNPLPSLF